MWSILRLQQSSTKCKEFEFNFQIKFRFWIIKYSSFKIFSDLFIKDIEGQYPSSFSLSFSSKSRFRDWDLIVYMYNQRIPVPVAVVGCLPERGAYLTVVAPSDFSFSFFFFLRHTYVFSRQFFVLMFIYILKRKNLKSQLFDIV